jgi:hypothetical protein
MINKEDILSFTFQEQFNYNKAYKLVNNWDEVLKQLPLERQIKIKEKAKEYDPLNSLKKIIKNISKNSINYVKYAFSKTSKNYGRLFAKSASYQGLPREFRAVLAEDYYWDIDYVNCHPSILEQYCIKKGINCSVLTKYNSNRDNIINEIKDKLNIDKSDVKDLFLTLINGGDRVGLTSMDEFLQLFKNEMKNIHNLIVQINPTILKQVKKVWGANEPNLNGKVVNCILCQVENELLLTAVEYLMNNGYNIDCLIFDGFLIRKDNNELTTELLDKTSKYVYNNTGYNLKLLHKDFNSIINLDGFNTFEEDELLKLKKDETYDMDKEEFEKNHFKIMCPPSYATLYDDKELYIQSTEHFKQSHSHKLTKKIIKLMGKSVIVNDTFTSHWFKDPNIRIYRKADFYPNIKLCPPDVYNLFNGFKADEYEPIVNKEDINGLIEPIINQLKVVAQDEYEFLIKYYAYIIQYPELKTNINIIIAGKDGTGKSIINDFFREKILGSELSSQTDDTDELFGKFSNIYVKKLFLQIDEISKEDFSKKKLEKLKNITTSKTIKYEKKGFDPITINNYLNTIMTTNNEFTVPISQTDRRNVFFKCENTYLGNYDYWTELSSHLKRNEVARAFYEYLLNYDLSSIFNNHNVESGLQFIRPQTKYNDEIKSLCLSYNYRFLSALASYDVEEPFIEFRAGELYNKYLNWFEGCKWGSKPSSVKKFFMDVKEILKDYKKKKEDANYYRINKKEIMEYLVKNNLYDEDAFFY